MIFWKIGDRVGRVVESSGRVYHEACALRTEFRRGGRYGIGGGPPIVLPVLGPSNLRDTVSKVPDVLLDPLYFFLSTDETIQVSAGEKINYTSLHEDDYEDLIRDALDPYVLLRDAYEQNRQEKIEE